METARSSAYRTTLRCVPLDSNLDTCENQGSYVVSCACYRCCKVFMAVLGCGILYSLEVDTDVSVGHAVSIFRVEPESGDSILLWNISIHTECKIRSAIDYYLQCILVFVSLTQFSGSSRSRTTITSFIVCCIMGKLGAKHLPNPGVACRPCILIGCFTATVLKTLTRGDACIDATRKGTKDHAG
jgi:hypothetical protein